MKKIILAFIWGLFLSVNSFAESIIANVDPLYVIENCADKKKSDIQLIVFNDWASENSYDTLMEKHSTKWNRHRKIVEIIEEELEYLSAINFTKLQNNDTFILKYMNYLGHTEFGKNHKSWNSPQLFKDTFDINYWLEQWKIFYLDMFKI